MSRGLNLLTDISNKNNKLTFSVKKKITHLNVILDHLT